MWPRWLTAFLAMLQEAWSAGRDAQIRFLKFQVEILRSPPRSALRRARNGRSPMGRPVAS